MDLLKQQTNNNKMSNSRKKVLIALIISLIALIASVIIILVIKNTKSNEFKLYIDETNIKITDTTFITEDGVKYISLNQISKLIGYDYRNGGYLEREPDANKCYLESNNQIIGYKANSKSIYKTTLDSNKDFQYFELQYPILARNNIGLYIALDDLYAGCNVTYSYSKSNNIMTIKSLDKLSNYYKTELDKYKVLVSDDEYENKKILSYGRIITQNEEKKFGLIDSNFQPIIGNRYNTMIFNEYTQEFIVSNSEGKYGIISIDGRIIKELQYEGIEIINYNPLLYKVQQNEKKGIMNEKGELIGAIIYDDIGIINKNDKKNILIIKDVIDSQDGVVVCLNKKYGIINLDNGDTILECDLDSISYENENDNIKYFVEFNNVKTTLEKYIDYVNTTVINIPN